MTLGLHNLTRNSGRSKKAKRLGRGWGSGKGKTSGKGIKGQKARSGGGKGLKLFGMRAALLSMPKLSTFKSMYPKLEVVTLTMLEKAFKNGDKVTPSVLKQKGLISTVKHDIKVVHNGELTKKLTVIVHKISAQAKESITKAGGSFKELTHPVVKKTEVETEAK